MAVRVGRAMVLLGLFGYIAGVWLALRP